MKFLYLGIGDFGKSALNFLQRNSTSGDFVLLENTNTEIVTTQNYKRVFVFLSGYSKKAYNIVGKLLSDAPEIHKKLHFVVVYDFNNKDDRLIRLLLDLIAPNGAGCAIHHLFNEKSEFNNEFLQKLYDSLPFHNHDNRIEIITPVPTEEDDFFSLKGKIIARSFIYDCSQSLSEQLPSELQKSMSQAKKLHFDIWGDLDDPLLKFVDLINKIHDFFKDDPNYTGFKPTFKPTSLSSHDSNLNEVRLLILEVG